MNKSGEYRIIQYNNKWNIVYFNECFYYLVDLRLQRNLKFIHDDIGILVGLFLDSDNGYKVYVGNLKNLVFKDITPLVVFKNKEDLKNMYELIL